MRVIVLLSTIALAVAGGAQGSPSRGSLSGTVTRGPITPVCAAEIPCDEPAPHVTLLFIRDGATAGRAVTDPKGRYVVRLPAGKYSVRRSSATAFDRKLEPNHVRVVGGRMTRVDFSIDTGIR
jgi:hypothetical protein